jgi:hypothetical protein
MTLVACCARRAEDALADGRRGLQLPRSEVVSTLVFVMAAD